MQLTRCCGAICDGPEGAQVSNTCMVLTSLGRQAQMEEMQANHLRDIKLLQSQHAEACDMARTASGGARPHSLSNRDHDDDEVQRIHVKHRLITGMSSATATQLQHPDPSAQDNCERRSQLRTRRSAPRTSSSWNCQQPWRCDAPS